MADVSLPCKKVEWRLRVGEEKKSEVAKEQERTEAFQLVEQLAMPELCFEELLDIASQLREASGMVDKCVYCLPDFEYGLDLVLLLCGHRSKNEK